MAKFSKRHLEAIAEVLKDVPVNEVLPKQHQGKLYYPAVHYFVLMDRFCEMAAASNKNFDRKRFLNAADCPYFDEVRMGVPVSIEYCVDCGKEVVNVSGEKPEQFCVPCLRKQHADLIDQ